MLTQLDHFKETLLDLLFPRRCVGCGRGGSFLCASCQDSLPRVVPPYCQSCGMSLGQGNLCAACRRSPLTIDGIRSLLLFEGTVREAILQLKYKNLKAIAAPFSQLLADYLKANPLPAEVLVPVPLHPRQLRERGYNQSALLAKELAKIYELPVVEGALLRLRNTAPQARTASAEERKNNVQEAFGCGDQRLEGRHVLLIDDVCTTGATLDSCAVALKAAGAASVWGLTVARET